MTYRAPPPFPPRRRFESHLKRFVAPAPFPVVPLAPSTIVGAFRTGRAVLPRDYALAYLHAERETDREIDGLWLDIGGG